MRPVVWGQATPGNRCRRSRPDNVASVPSPEALTNSRAATTVNALGAVNASLGEAFGERGTFDKLENQCEHAVNALETIYRAEPGVIERGQYWLIQTNPNNTFQGSATRTSRDLPDHDL